MRPLPVAQIWQKSVKKVLFSNIFSDAEREPSVSRITFLPLGSVFNRYNQSLTSSKAAVVARNLGDESLKELTLRSKVEDKNRLFAKIFTILEASVDSLYDAQPCTGEYLE